MSIPKAARNAAYKKHGKICSHCGKKKRLSLHHLDSNPDNHHVDNLLVLCRGKYSCHSFAEMIIHHHKKGLS